MYTRNSDPDYYWTNQRKTNCGSYALRLKEWYDPIDDFFEKTGMWISEWIDHQGEKGYSNFEISTLYRDILVDCLLEEFKGELELCNGKIPTNSSLELISFNTFCIYDPDECADFDFHFKVFRDGEWSEKCGWGEVRDCDEADWVYPFGEYIGKPVYFYHKIAQEK